jgi:mono/diheme cytochrome c family protein
MKSLSMLLGMLIATLLAACAPDDLDFSYSDLPPGDPVRGAEVFSQPVDGGASCLTCHVLDEGRSAGPSLQGYGAIAAGRVERQSAEDYTFYSILRPARHIVQGYSNTMPGDYEQKLSRQVIADLIAYLLSL